MLERGEGDLANLIIHEMVHATIFVKDSIDFNENLATFIGDRGAEQFLIATHGKGFKRVSKLMWARITTIQNTVNICCVAQKCWTACTTP
jgi:predicted aminopeptidase